MSTSEALERTAAQAKLIVAEKHAIDQRQRVVNLADKCTIPMDSVDMTIQHYRALSDTELEEKCQLARLVEVGCRQVLAERRLQKAQADVKALAESPKGDHKPAA